MSDSAYFEGSLFLLPTLSSPRGAARTVSETSSDMNLIFAVLERGCQEAPCMPKATDDGPGCPDPSVRLLSERLFGIWRSSEKLVRFSGEAGEASFLKFL